MLLEETEMAVRRPINRRFETGQSLVETALILPFLLIIIAGLVEIGQLIIIQSRADTAARIGARFGANGGEPDGIRIATLNSVTQTLSLDEEKWDIWVFNGRINDLGTAFTIESWSWEHVYGLGLTTRFASTSESSVQQDVLEHLRSEGDQNASELNVVGVLIYHDVETILGLENYIRGLNSVRGFAVMEVAPVVTARVTEACSGFPIILEYGQRSISTTSYNGITNWEYPAYADRPNLSSFLGHQADLPLDQAPEGSVFYFSAPNSYPLGGITTNFDWLAWNKDNPDPALDQLQASLTWPGNSVNADPLVAYADPVTGLPGMHALDPANPSTYDLVLKAPVTIDSSIRDIMHEHVERGRGIRLLVWERDLSGDGYISTPEQAYKIRGFAVARIIGYQLEPSSGTHWIMVELLRWETSCGARSGS